MGDQIHNSIVDNRITPQTRKIYENHLKTIVQFCVSENLNEAINTAKTKLIIPMEKAVIEAFLDRIGVEKEDGTMKAFQTVNTYISSIKFAHTERNIVIVDEIKIFLKKYSDGYKRKIAQKKNE